MLVHIKNSLVGMGGGQRPYSQLPLHSDCTKKVGTEGSESAIKAQQRACGNERRRRGIVMGKESEAEELILPRQWEWKLRVPGMRWNQGCAGEG